MELYIEGVNGNYTWNVGRVPTFKKETVHTIGSVQADGDELEYIRNHTTGIPFTDKRVVTWRGSFAVFIVENLIFSIQER